MMSHLANGGGFAHAIDPYHQVDCEPVVYNQVLALAQVLPNEFLEFAGQSGGICDSLFFDNLPQVFDELEGGLSTYIGLDEDFFQLFQEIFVNFGEAGKEGIDFFRETLARFGQFFFEGRYESSHKKLLLFWFF
jgi:hypothetical protein